MVPRPVSIQPYAFTVSLCKGISAVRDAVKYKETVPDLALVTVLPGSKTRPGPVGLPIFIVGIVTNRQDRPSNRTFVLFQMWHKSLQ